MRIVLVTPDIEVMNVFDGRKDAWVLSRPNIKDVENTGMDEIEGMDLPLLGAKIYQFHIRSSMLFRDILLSIRPLPGAWARSMRINPMDEDNVEVSTESYYQMEQTKGMLNEYFNLLEQGYTLDYAKAFLPTSVITDYSVCIDDRTLVAFLRMLEEHMYPLYQCYGPKFLSVIGMDEEQFHARKVSDIFYRYALSENEYNEENGVDNIGDMIYGRWTVPYNIMAQFIRMSYANVKNGLWNIVALYNHIPVLQSNSRVMVAVYTNVGAFDRTVANRSCWVAKWSRNDDGWGPITESFLKRMTPEEFKKHLPCHGCYNGCPFQGDLKARVNLEDVGMPCPLQVEDPSLVYKFIKRYNADSYTATMWQMMANLKMIPDNPNNKIRKEYEENLEVYGVEGPQVEED